MFTKFNLRLATLNIPVYSEIALINGKQKLRGLKIFTNIVELFERAGFNVSLVSVDEQTTGIADENGTYNGLYGAVQSGKANTSFIAAPLRIAESIGQFTTIMTDALNAIMTKREPVQVSEGTLYHCLTTLGPLNNLIFGAIATFILLFLSLLGSKRASWNFFSQIMTEKFVQFRPLSLHLTFMVALFMLRAIFGSAYSTDVTVSIPPKLINSLEDLAKSKLLPIWFQEDPVYLEFKQKVTKAHADVFNMALNNRSKIVPMVEFQTNCSEHFETNSILYFGLLNPFLTKCVCKCKSSEVCSGGFRMFISEPFSRTPFAYVSSNNTSDSTADALKKYGNQFLEQSLFGNAFKTATDESFASSPQCANEMSKGVEAVTATDTVGTRLVPWRETIFAMITAAVAFSVEIMLTLITFIFSVRRYYWM